jgi:hypothetical protein
MLRVFVFREDRTFVIRVNEMKLHLYCETVCFDSKERLVKSVCTTLSFLAAQLTKQKALLNLQHADIT